jgi:hypothetical protein
MSYTDRLVKGQDPNIAADEINKPDSCKKYLQKWA